MLEKKNQNFSWEMDWSNVNSNWGITLSSNREYLQMLTNEIMSAQLVKNPLGNVIKTTQTQAVTFNSQIGRSSNALVNSELKSFILKEVV